LKKDTEGFSLDIARANERSAEANRIAEQERLARLKIEERLAPRRISADQRTKLAKGLKLLSGKTVSLFIMIGDPETDAFGKLLSNELMRAGLKVEIHPDMYFPSTKVGISLAIGQNREADAEILSTAFIEAELAEKPIHAEKISGETVARTNELQILLGRK